jgi:hypothetical protein
MGFQSVLQDVPIGSKVWTNFIKLFYICNLEMLVIKLVFDPSRPFQPSLMLVSKDHSLSSSDPQSLGPYLQTLA